MRAGVLAGVESVRVEERERPTPGPEEVLVRMRRVGICGSDVHYWEHGRIGEFVVEDDLVLGHEPAGEVVATGERVAGVEPGTRVAVEPGIPCRRCDYCSRGAYNLCPSIEFMATPPHDGAFVEYVAWPADLVYELPASVSIGAGAFCEPLSVCLEACRRGDVGVTDTVLVTGCGPIGLLAASVADARGAGEVLVSDVVPEKLDRARRRGVDRAFDVSETDLATAVDEHTDGAGVDVVIEASGAPAAVRSTVEAVRRGGTVVLVGLPHEDEVPLDVVGVVTAGIDVHGSFRFENTFPAAIDLLASGAVDVEGLVDFTAPLDDLGEAFERVRDDPGVVKGAIEL
jgi:L-iditol 2-dehydrogenase